MIDRSISVHLQDFPDTSFLNEEKDLMEKMDLIRDVCTTALALRDNKNLRVRLPLNKLKIIGKKPSQILDFIDIIKDEINVKTIEVEENIGDLAELKLQINFKKIGAKFGSKVKEITDSARKNEWKKISKNEIEIAGVKLIDDEFEIKLIAKNADEKKFSSAPLPDNSGIIELDIEITKELEDEGIARDIIRAVQQNRKDANLNITDRINLSIISEDERILSVAKDFEDYISNQILSNSITCVKNKDATKKDGVISFENKIDDGSFVAKFFVELK